MLGFVFRLFSLFCAGVFFQMSVVHLLRPEETRSHPMIARSRSPRRASAAWGLVQLASALAIAAAFRFSLGFNWESLAAFLGFAAWGMLLADLAARKLVGAGGAKRA